MAISISPQVERYCLTVGARHEEGQNYTTAYLHCAAHDDRGASSASRATRSPDCG